MTSATLRSSTRRARVQDRRSCHQTAPSLPAQTNDATPTLMAKEQEKESIESTPALHSATKESEPASTPDAESTNESESPPTPTECPSMCGRHSEQLVTMETTLRSRSDLIGAQPRDLVLGPKHADLQEGRQEKIVLMSTIYSGMRPDVYLRTSSGLCQYHSSPYGCNEWGGVTAVCLGKIEIRFTRSTALKKRNISGL